MLITPVVWDFYYVHLLIPWMVIGWSSQARSQQHMLLLIAILFVLLQRYWRYMLLYLQTPWLMMFGMLGVAILWLALLSLPPQPNAATSTAWRALQVRPDATPISPGDCSDKKGTSCH